MSAKLVFFLAGFRVLSLLDTLRGADFMGMMIMELPPGTALAVSVAGLVIITILTLPAIRSLVKWLRRLYRFGRADDGVFKHFYQDKDGEATVESVKATTATIRRVAIVIIGVADGAVTLSRAIVAPVDIRDAWLQFGISVRNTPHQIFSIKQD